MQVLLYCCTAVLLYYCAAVLLYCCGTAGVLLGYCWGAGVSFQNFSWVALTSLKILWECRILLENALGLNQ